jgi:hypothetical protein
VAAQLRLGRGGGRLQRSLRAGEAAAARAPPALLCLNRRACSAPTCSPIIPRGAQPPQPTRALHRALRGNLLISLLGAHSPGVARVSKLLATCPSSLHVVNVIQESTQVGARRFRALIPPHARGAAAARRPRRGSRMVSAGLCAGR